MYHHFCCFHHKFPFQLFIKNSTEYESESGLQKILWKSVWMIFEPSPNGQRMQQKCNALNHSAIERFLSVCLRRQLLELYAVYMLTYNIEEQSFQWLRLTRRCALKWQNLFLLYIELQAVQMNVSIGHYLLVVLAISYWLVLLSAGYLVSMNMINWNTFSLHELMIFIETHNSVNQPTNVPS